jgi:hypothetical protein
MNIIYPETLLRQRVKRLEAAAGTAALNERTRIVDWLRALDAETDISRYLPITLANWIDAGVHNTRQDT